MAASVTVFLDTLPIVVELSFESGDAPETTSILFSINGQRIPIPLHVSDAKCDALLDHLADLRAARLRR